MAPLQGTFALDALTPIAIPARITIRYAPRYASLSGMRTRASDIYLDLVLDTYLL